MNEAVLYWKYWPTQPAAWGEDMLVPFSSWVPRSVKLDTEVMAAPGAHTVTPLSPSIVGPLEDHVKGIPGSFWRSEYSACIISGETYAPTPVKNVNKLLYSKILYKALLKKYLFWFIIKKAQWCAISFVWNKELRTCYVVC